ncbi:hypothetical protein ACJX0J_039645, partial [Zea mays]
RKEEKCIALSTIIIPFHNTTICKYQQVTFFVWSILRYSTINNLCYATVSFLWLTLLQSTAFSPKPNIILNEGSNFQFFIFKKTAKAFTIVVVISTLVIYIKKEKCVIYFNKRVQFGPTLLGLGSSKICYYYSSAQELNLTWFQPKGARIHFFIDGEVGSTSTILGQWIGAYERHHLKLFSFNN